MKISIHPFYGEISKYDTSVFVNAFSQLNYKVYNNRIKTGESTIKVDMRKYGYWNLKNPILLLSHWTLRDIVLQKVRRPRLNEKHNLFKIITDKQMILIILLYYDYENQQCKSQLNKDDLFYSIYGIGEQQFRCQTNNYQFAIKRNQIIYNEINVCLGRKIDLDEVFSNMLQMSYKEFEFILYTIMSIPLTHNSIYLKEYPDGYFKKVDLFEDFEAKYLRIIDYFTGNYEKLIEIDFHLSRYLYPFIQIDDKNYLIDCFMMQDKLSDAVSWIAREYYKRKIHIYKSNYFPNNFGELFEKYIEKIILSNVHDYRLYNLNNSEADILYLNKILGKKADFLIETINYRFVIECKSGIKSIYSRDTLNNSLILKKFFDKIFNEGAEQIIKTIDSITPSDKKTVGVIVHYEEAYLKTKIKYEYLKEVGKDYFNNILFIDITEFELIISIMKDNILLAEEILSDYILASQQGDFVDLISHISNRAKNARSFLEDIELFTIEGFL